MHVTLTPAYGRDYTSAYDAEADFRADLDFIIHLEGGRTTYINRSQLLEAFPGQDVNLRYMRLAKVHVIPGRRVEGERMVARTPKEVRDAKFAPGRVVIDPEGRHVQIEGRAGDLITVKFGSTYATYNKSALMPTE